MDYKARMEAVLATYERPLRAEEPVVCLDERPIQLTADTRPPSRARPGRPARHDYECKRHGTANLFCAVEPKAGWHLVRATPNRTGPEFAKVIRAIVDHFPAAETIHLVMDNLSTHSRKSLTDRYGEAIGGDLWGRLAVHHYTPKHASWLNQAEIAIGLLIRECLGRRAAVASPTCPPCGGRPPPGSAGPTANGAPSGGGSPGARRARPSATVASPMRWAAADVADRSR